MTIKVWATEEEIFIQPEGEEVVYKFVFAQWDFAMKSPEAFKECFSEFFRSGQYHYIPSPIQEVVGMEPKFVFE